jgi:hypothetical protein
MKRGPSPSCSHPRDIVILPHGRHHTWLRRRLIVLGALGAFACVGHIGFPSHALAQMPDLRQMSGKPLPVSEIPEGTVTVRVARQMPVNAAVGVEVTATVQTEDGPDHGGVAEDAKRVETTGDDGRVTFSGIPAGAIFQARTEVDGETLETARFRLPAGAGVRTMLIAGIGAPPPSETVMEVPGGAAPGGNADPMAASNTPVVTGGEAQTDATLPTGRLEIALVDASSRPIADHPINVVKVERGGGMESFQATTDASGRAVLTDLPVSDEAGYMAVAVLPDVRVRSVPFRMTNEGGVRIVNMGPPQPTDDESVLSLDSRTRIIIELTEEHLQIGEVLSIQNKSGKLFDPGLSGLSIPLPDESVSFRNFSEQVMMEEVKNKGAVIRATVPPSGARGSGGLQAQFMFLLPTHNSETLTVEQPMPFGVETPLLIIPERYHLTVSADGLKTLRSDKDKQGNTVSLYELPSVPRGGTLRFTIGNIPAPDKTGQKVATFMASALGLFALIGFITAKKGGNKVHEKRRQDLENRRETLFQELVELEKKRRAAPDNTAIADKRNKTAVALETVLADIAKLEQES